MAVIMESIHKFEDRLNRNGEWFAAHHPKLAFLAMFIAMPILIFLAVIFCTTVVVLLGTWIFE